MKKFYFKVKNTDVLYMVILTLVIFAGMDLLNGEFRLTGQWFSWFSLSSLFLILFAKTEPAE